MAGITKPQEIDYLYEDLPTGSTITAEVWNDIMSMLKDTINNNARALGSVVEGSFILNIKASDWEEPRDPGYDPYTIYIPAQIHLRGVTPRIICTSNGNSKTVYPDMAEIYYVNGDITLNSFSRKEIKVVIF